MEVTSVKIQKLITEPRKMLVAVASIIIDGMLVINDVRILKSDEKLFIAMPSRQLEDGLYKDVVHPINREGRKILEEAVLGTYAAYLEDLEATAAAEKSESPEPEVENK